MSKTVNLRQRRKRAARDTKRQDAEAARARSGRSKAEKQRADDEMATARRRLDGLRLDHEPPDGRADD